MNNNFFAEIEAAIKNLKDAVNGVDKTVLPGDTMSKLETAEDILEDIIERGNETKAKPQQLDSLRVLRIEFEKRLGEIEKQQSTAEERATAANEVKACAAGWMHACVYQGQISMLKDVLKQIDQEIKVNAAHEVVNSKTVMEDALLNDPHSLPPMRALKYADEWLQRFIDDNADDLRLTIIAALEWMGGNMTLDAFNKLFEDHYKQR